MKIIGIAGGSGSGKSTVSYALVDEQPKHFEVINLDDYQKPRDNVDLPLVENMINWDHPDVVRWDDLITDIEKLKSSLPITIQTWAHRSNPDYFAHYKTIPRTTEPKPVIIIEGYLALHHPKLNKMYDASFYLDLDEATRNWRRDKGAVLAQDEYLLKVLKPMHDQFVEPSKQNADHIINVGGLSANEVKQKILKGLDFSAY